jgi:hypothetical protein
MIKIAFLGSDSTHTEAFARLINFSNSKFHKYARVVSIYGENLEETKRKAKELNILKHAISIEDALEGVDLAFVIGRFGDSHYLPTKAAILKKIPVFVDKPFTLSVEESKDLIALSDKLMVPMFSSSPLRFSKEIILIKTLLLDIDNDLINVCVKVPANCTDLGDDARLNSVYFYGIHGIEILLEIIGYEFNEITIDNNKTFITTSLHTPNGNINKFELIRNASEFYWVEIHTKTNNYFYNIELDGSYYENEIEYILNWKNNNSKVIPLISTHKCISIMNEIELSEINAISND